MSGDTQKTDRRVSRTRRLLRDALMALILERGYDAVTVEDITGRADMGRTTFYLHYRDKEELLVESVEAIARELKAQVDHLEFSMVEDARFHPSPLVVAFRHADEKRDLYRIILKGEGGGQAARRIRDIIYESAADFFTTRMRPLMDGEPEIPLPVVAGYFASAMLGFMTWWLEKELAYSGEEAAELFSHMFFQGARQVMHLRFDG